MALLVIAHDVSTRDADEFQRVTDSARDVVVRFGTAAELGQAFNRKKIPPKQEIDDARP